MYRFNLNNLRNEDVEIVENYLQSKQISLQMFEHFAQISFNDGFKANTNDESFLEVIELSIIHNDIFMQNKDILMKVCSLENKSNIIEILQLSIDDEKTIRFKENLENMLNKSDKRLNKPIDLIDKKIKI